MGTQSLNGTWLKGAVRESCGQTEIREDIRRCRVETGIKYDTKSGLGLVRSVGENIDNFEDW